MPIYEYNDPGTGAAVDLRFPPGKAPDTITLQRVRVPRRVGTIIGAKPPTMGDQLAAGYRKLEERGQLSPKGSRHLPISTIKAALAQPD
ncbi:hypothetical protein OpiT1DRAFT_05302 [Opitutaceae bacterium TAV1]|nr:hypothetical protein OpiT1DRAFT_05302 [Opitutaceae bacterium TAV1]